MTMCSLSVSSRGPQWNGYVRSVSFHLCHSIFLNTGMCQHNKEHPPSLSPSPWFPCVRFCPSQTKAHCQQINHSQCFYLGHFSYCPRNYFGNDTLQFEYCLMHCRPSYCGQLKEMWFSQRKNIHCAHNT